MLTDELKDSYRKIIERYAYHVVKSLYFDGLIIVEHKDAANMAADVFTKAFLFYMAPLVLLLTTTL